MKLQSLRSSLAVAMALAVATALPVRSAETAAPGALSLELNGAQPSDKGCRVTFVVTNGLSADISVAAFELALFNSDGVVDRLTVLEFRDLPAGKTKVSRFDLAGADCGKISRILINTSTQCSGAGIEAADCMRGIKTSAKAGIGFGV